MSSSMWVLRVEVYGSQGNVSLNLLMHTIISQM